ncbi:MAG: tRNA (cytosine(32)/uridine(32)-2'-O)-methyltransferase TrmJ [Proteobacteria bacterium]|nr:tRNA (cytosine(32)/uridine(32)-2'-O)-methyltransferase TrmJ [Pseudomonadota bacterium]|tara:strand:- start:3449 stop:4180 length:732 start_codon:yes stop_codon:yes gene_type:complete
MNKKNNIDIEFILVEPSHSGNIGACARAIKNMGFEKLAIVKPRKTITEEAFHRAKSAKDILENAVIYESFDQAIEEKNLILATSARERTIPWPTFYIDEISEEIKGELKSEKTKSAIIFGREDNGLSNEELQKCHIHLVIPTSDEYSSLNLSHALQLVAFEIRKIYLDNNVPISEEKDLVSNLENEKLLEHLMEVLKKIDFYDPKSSKQVKTRIERLIKKIRLDKMEMGILRGFLSKIIDFEK